MTISINNPHLAIVAGMKTKPEIGPATNMQDLYRRNEAGDYWECGYLPGKALPENNTGWNSTLIGQKWGELAINVQGGSAGIEPKPNPGTGGPAQWRTELYRMRVTLTRPLPTNNFTMWCAVTCSDVGWNGFMALGGGPYIYNLPPQYNFQAGRPGTQGIVATAYSNPSNRLCTVVADGDNGIVYFYIDNILIGSSVRSYPAGMNLMDVFSGWNGDARLNGRIRLFGVLGRAMLPEEVTMLHERHTVLRTVGEGLP